VRKYAMKDAGGVEKEMADEVIGSKPKANEEKEQTPSEPCPECGSTVIYRDPTRGEIICGNCGIVISERYIDQGPEWRAFSSEEKEGRSRVGAPTTFAMHDKGLSTVIDRRDIDVYGNKLVPSRRAQIYRLRKWQIRSMVHNSVQRNLATAMSELDRLTSQLGIPRDIKETAAIIYRKALERRLVRGRTIDGVTAAAVYLACRLHHVPRALEEIVTHTHAGRKELGRSIRLILHTSGIAIPRPKPQDFISRFGEDLRMSVNAQRRAIEIIDQAQAMGLTAGKDPTGMAAAALYIAGLIEGERRTQQEVAGAAHITEVTVRNRYKEMVQKLNLKVEV
jgi:transcription initiation factor TFIIB